MSSTEGLSTGSTHDYLLNSDEEEETLQRSFKSVTPKPKKRFNNSKSSPGSQSELDECVLVEIEDLLTNVSQIADNFTVTNKIGSGTFSSVYVAKLKNFPHVKQSFALKYLIPTSHPSRIENELKCLQQIGGSDHVMGVKACLRERDHVVIVMPYFPHDKFQDYVQILSVAEVRDYMRAMLIALRRVHSAHIIHRDVKPSNFLYNRATQQYALVDFGLAQKVPGKSAEGLRVGKENTGDNLTNKTKHRPNKDMERHHPQKRKHSEQNTENSPRKRRQIEDSPCKPLAERNVNIQPSKIPHSPHKQLKLEAMKREGSLGAKERSLSVKDTSLSRALLKRRALETLEEQQGSKGAVQVAPPSSGLQKQTTCSVVLDKSGKQVYRNVATSTCDCYAKPQICTLCSARSNQHAPRAGTPGFRAPEVLLKCPDQTTAVDIWSTGVIFLSLLSGRYPFFKAPDDVTALAQIISVFGTKTMQRTAKALGKNLITDPEMPVVDLMSACQKLRGCPKTKTSQTVSKGNSRLSGQYSGDSGGWDNVPLDAYDLLHRLLDLNPYTRITADEALKHPFFS